MVGKVLAWVKAHLMPVICIVIVCISLPVAYVFSTKMAKRVEGELQSKVKSELNKVDHQRVSYQLQAFTSGGEEVSLSHPPNAALTKWFAEQGELLRAEADLVADEGLRFNKRDHGVLVSGLFPEPTNSDDRRLKPYEFLRVLMGYRSQASVVDALMDRVSGGEPPDPARVAIQIDEEKTRYLAELERQRGPGQSLSTAEQEAMVAHLREARIDQYRRQALRLSVYLDPEVLLTAIEIPDEEPATPPSPASLFEKQWNVWVVTDILDAIALANTDNRGRPQRVVVPTSSGSLGSIVKRVNSIDVRIGGENLYGSLGYRGDKAVVERQAMGSNAGLAGTADTLSLTGRLSHPDNQVYDVIDVRLDLIVDVERLPRLLRAFEEINFMSVLDVDLEEVDVWKELQDGYVYGKGSIAQATIMVETVWLRDWTAALMPPEFAAGLGVEGFIETDDDD